MTWKCIQFVTILMLLENIQGISASVMHSHTKEIYKERESDGAYSPRDHAHYSDNGEHNTAFDHEAILGSHSEAEEFDNLPPEKAKERLVELLKKMDLNNDNNVDRNELKAWILRSFRMLSEEEALERLAYIDANHDGLISWDEYKSDTYDSDEEDNSNLIDDDKTIWNAADSNKDGNLNSKEFTVFTHPEEHPAMLPIFLDQTLRDKDKNKDGHIDFQEFVGNSAKDHDKQWLTEQKHSFDTEYDKDNDGKLTGNEILSWIVPSNEEIAEEEVNHLFAESDDNHDDLLSFSEVLEHYDTFVGSEATDYGDYLYKSQHFPDEL
ncbi:hypothetical protein WA026_001140 [Henosepilachna vigintioctopunctata]|uniref:Reticulocalbin-3 n=1 Tax=Henosepilachna vigintioctopunctata TaxID=420089 RepID=A0AAW1V0R4_9CUCU